MAFDDEMRAAGHTKVLKKKFFAEVDDEGRAKSVEEVPQVDCTGDPVNPHVWVPAGKKFRCYTDDSSTALDTKIKTKAKPDFEIGMKMEKLK